MFYTLPNIRSHKNQTQKLRILVNIFKNLKLTKICLRSTHAKRKRCHGCATWRMHNTRPARPVETEDDFFCHLAGWSAPTGLAIVHLIGCINTIKSTVPFQLELTFPKNPPSIDIQEKTQFN